MYVDWSLSFLVAAIALFGFALTALVIGVDYIGLTLAATACALVSCAFSAYNAYRSKT
jgi:uncharacterized membrane protein YciS (DUF1049 family)